MYSNTNTDLSTCAEADCPDVAPSRRRLRRSIKTPRYAIITFCPRDCVTQVLDRINESDELITVKQKENVQATKHRLKIASFESQGERKGDGLADAAYEESQKCLSQGPSIMHVKSS
jgi:hypothetical protein